MIDRERTSGAWIFVPYCKLMIAVNGQLSELPHSMRELIEGYDIQTEESGATTLTFSVHDPEFILLNSSILTEDTAVYFEFGWANDWNNIQRFNGYISLVDFKFEKSGYPSLDITCMDETHIMNREEKTRTFENMKRSAIAEQIFKEYGIPCVVEDSGERSDDIPEKTTQSNETDIAFLQKLAGEVIGNIFICYLENGVGYFCKRNFATEAVMDFHYRDAVGNDIESFECSVNKETIKHYKSSGDVSTTDGSSVTQVADAPTTDTKTQPDTVSPSNNTPTSNSDVRHSLNADGSWT